MIRPVWVTSLVSCQLTVTRVRSPSGVVTGVFRHDHDWVLCRRGVKPVSWLLWISSEIIRVSNRFIVFEICYGFLDRVATYLIWYPFEHSSECLVLWVEIRLYCGDSHRFPLVLILELCGLSYQSSGGVPVGRCSGESLSRSFRVPCVGVAVWFRSSERGGKAEVAPRWRPE